MKIYGQLESAALEQLSSDPTALVQGRVYDNTTSGKTIHDDGTNKRAFIKNDQKAIFGNDATAANNVRIHKGPVGVLQLTPGNDTTAEGSTVTNVQQLSQRSENLAVASLPTAGQIGRHVYITDQKVEAVDDGTAYRRIIPESTANDATTGGTVSLATITSSVVRLTASITTINMIPAGYDSQRFTLVNKSGADISILNDSGGTAANRIFTGSGGNITLVNGSGMILQYDATSSRWQVNGISPRSSNSRYAIRSVTTTDSATISDDILLLSGASFTETLPTAVGNSGKEFILNHVGTSLTQVYTLATTGGQTIGGIASGSYALYTNGESLRIVSDNANWQIVSHRTSTAWATYTPNAGVNQGLGTVASPTIKWKREGEDIIIQDTITTGTVSAAEARLALPDNMTSASTYPTLSNVGVASDAGSTAVSGVLMEASKGYMTFGYFGSTAGSLVKRNGSLLFASTSVVSISARIRITGWQP